MLRHSLPAVSCTHASGRAVTLPGVRQHRQGGRSVVDIDAELNAAPWMPSVTRASRMTNVAANCRQRHPSADGYRTARSKARAESRGPAEMIICRDTPSRGRRSRITSGHLPWAGRVILSNRHTGSTPLSRGAELAARASISLPTPSPCSAGGDVVPGRPGSCCGLLGGHRGHEPRTRGNPPAARTRNTRSAGLSCAPLPAPGGRAARGHWSCGGKIVLARVGLRWEAIQRGRWSAGGPEDTGLAR